MIWLSMGKRYTYLEDRIRNHITTCPRACLPTKYLLTYLYSTNLQDMRCTANIEFFFHHRS